jgi:hypothetical protein
MGSPRDRGTIPFPYGRTPGRSDAGHRMGSLKRNALAGFFLASLLQAQSPLLPGEGLATSGPEGVRQEGETSVEAPMGSLAKLIWLRLEGEAWAAQHVTYTCTGRKGTWRCWNQGGHGEVDLPRATELSCNLAFLSWIEASAERWKRDLGEGAARARLEAVFTPFLGHRFPMGDALPTFTPDWVGDGPLLRTSPERMLAWLIQPDQAALRAQCQTLLSVPGEGWWMKTGTAPNLGPRGGTSAWVVGGNGPSMAVLHLPKGRGKAEGLARFRALMETPRSPTFKGDPGLQADLEESMRSALQATTAYGPWPETPWELKLHDSDHSFETATGAPRARSACWVGSTLHLRPWEELRRRDIGRVLRHEATHRRLEALHLDPWEEEARCLYAELHPLPPEMWPEPPTQPLRHRLNRALNQGTTGEQAWAYQALRAWGAGKPLPDPPQGAPAPQDAQRWVTAPAPIGREVVVVWPPERMPLELEINGKALPRLPGKLWRFEGAAHFGASAPMRHLEGEVTALWTGEGWSLSWNTSAAEWIAAATAGEYGEEAPYEARRALAAVLARWLEGHPEGNHADGSFCPLTHCAVVRSSPLPSTREAANHAPLLPVESANALFCGSKGGVSLSPRQVWGTGSSETVPVPKVPGDRWAEWSRRLTPEQVQHLKSSIKPGIKAGQSGMRLGPSGPYAIEVLRLEAGRAFGWTLWPSNACEGTSTPEGGLELHGHGWGHNVGLCLATAAFRAKQGWSAEAILEEAFGPSAR